MSVNEKVDVETGDYGSIVAEPKNAVAYGKRRTIALGALCVLAFGAAVALTKTKSPLALENFGKICLPYCPENLEVCPAPPTGCSYGEAHTDSCGCQTGCPPVDCPSNESENEPARKLPGLTATATVCTSVRGAAELESTVALPSATS